MPLVPMSIRSTSVLTMRVRSMDVMCLSVVSASSQTPMVTKTQRPVEFINAWDEERSGNTYACFFDGWCGCALPGAWPPGFLCGCVLPGG